MAHCRLTLSYAQFTSHEQAMATPITSPPYDELHVPPSTLHTSSDGRSHYRRSLLTIPSNSADSLLSPVLPWTKADDRRISTRPPSLSLLHSCAGKYMTLRILKPPALSCIHTSTHRTYRAHRLGPCVFPPRFLGFSIGQTLERVASQRVEGDTTNSFAPPDLLTYSRLFAVLVPDSQRRLLPVEPSACASHWPPLQREGSV